MISIKPDGIFRGLIGEILKFIEDNGYHLLLMKLVMANLEKIKAHLIKKEGKSYLEPLVSSYINKPMLVSVWEGIDMNHTLDVHKGRADPLKGDPASIRYIYSIKKFRNCVHVSESPQEALHDIKVWFSDEEMKQIDL